MNATREAVFTKILAWDAILGKKLYFGLEMIEVGDAGSSLKTSSNVGSGPLLTVSGKVTAMALSPLQCQG